mmetsp:Transcript_918/g.5779  ORF Transcript_918/g.5779 Transcript_918/m.5779 type:complete len:185 (-) Transcript_918:505-1059(-)
MHLIETLGSGLGEEELPDLKRAFVCRGREESPSLVLGFACTCMEAEEPRRLGGRADLKLPTTDTAPSLPFSRFVPAWLFVEGLLLEDPRSRGNSGAAGVASGKEQDGPGAAQSVCRFPLHWSSFSAFLMELQPLLGPLAKTWSRVVDKFGSCGNVLQWSILSQPSSDCLVPLFPEAFEISLCLL